MRWWYRLRLARSRMLPRLRLYRVADDVRAEPIRFEWNRYEAHALFAGTPHAEFRPARTIGAAVVIGVWCLGVQWRRP